MESVSLTLCCDELEFPLDLSAGALSTLVELLPDNGELGDLIRRLARHPNSEVRASVAGKDQLPMDVALELSSDPAFAVVDSLLRSSEAAKSLPGDVVLSLCRRDPQLAAHVARRFEDLEGGRADVIDFLASHPDALVREAVAGNPFVPRTTLRQLAESDPSRHVRASAKEILL